MAETRLSRDHHFFVTFGVAQGVNIPGIETSIAGMAPFEYGAAFMSINAAIVGTGQ